MEGKQLRITFEYRDNYTRGDKWSKQICVCSSLEECKKFYGLEQDPTCEYRIVSIEEV